MCVRACVCLIMYLRYQSYLLCQITLLTGMCVYALCMCVCVYVRACVYNHVSQVSKLPVVSDYVVNRYVCVRVVYVCVRACVRVFYHVSQVSKLPVVS